MKFLPLVLVLFCLCGVSKAVEDNHEYLVKMSIVINEQAAPGFVKDQIMYHMLTKNITAKDICEVTGVDQITLTELTELANKYNVNITSMLNYRDFLEVLHSIEYNFVSYFDEVVKKWDLNKEQTKLIDVLTIFNMTLQEYTSALYFYDESYFKPQLMTPENVMRALNTVGKNSDELFATTRDVLLNHLYYGLNQTFFATKIFPNYKYFLSSANITMQNIYRVRLFKDMLDMIVYKSNEISMLGVLTEPNKLTINRKNYEQWKNGSDVVKIAAQSVINMRVNLQARPQVTQRAANIFELTTSENVTTTIKPTRQIGNCANATYVTVDSRNQLISWNVSVGVLNNDKLATPGNISVFHLGSLLICNQSLIGIAAETNATHIIFDTLYNENDQFVPPTPSGSVSSTMVVSSMILVITNVLLFLKNLE